MRAAVQRQSRLTFAGRAAFIASGALCFLLAGYLMAIALSDRLLTEYGAPPQADALVVLGGDGPSRALKAAELWREGSASRIRVAGEGDCFDIRDIMIANGVPAAAISVECLSRSTWENAFNTVLFADLTSLRSAILVTSWFHSKRALETFRAICPGVSWYSELTDAPDLFETAFGHYGRHVALEYVKLAVYRLRIALFTPRTTITGICGGLPAHRPISGIHAIG